jgi:hypothetical protein
MNKKSPLNRHLGVLTLLAALCLTLTLAQTNLQTKAPVKMRGTTIQQRRQPLHLLVSGSLTHI